MGFTLTEDGSFEMDNTAELKAEIERLRAALKKHGDHTPRCASASEGSCDCGWEAALRRGNDQKCR
jgi:hypothetical protein